MSRIINKEKIIMKGIRKYEKNLKNGFTLVELLAVIVILAIILVIAVPKVMSVIEDSKKATLESTAKMIASSAEKQKVQNTVLGNNEEITCDSVVKINKGDYANCSIEFEDNTAKVTIEGSGKFDGLYVCNGTKTNAVAAEEECEISVGSVETGASFLEVLFAQESTLHNGLIKDDTADQNIRYAGAEAYVKNKVYFNCAETDGTNAYGSDNYDYASSCEIWRIIGVFATKSTYNQTEKPVKRIKIVRDEILSESMDWDIEGEPQWGETTLTSDNTTSYAGSTLKQYLNDGEDSYYNSLSSIAKSQIGDALWHTGLVEAGTASEVYISERSGVTSEVSTINYTSEWVGKIGLIYPSDFGYAGTNCGNYSIYDYSNEDSCGKTNNWLTESYWTISPLYFAAAHIISYDGRCNSYPMINLSGDVGGGDMPVRPSTYLSSNVQIKDGNGGDEPYILTIE